MTATTNTQPVETTTEANTPAEAFIEATPAAGTAPTSVEDQHFGTENLVGVFGGTIEEDAPVSDTVREVDTALIGLIDRLQAQDEARRALETVATEMSTLRTALDGHEPSDLVIATVEGVRIPMTAASVLEAKRVQLHRGMHLMSMVFGQLVDRSDNLLTSSYLDRAAELANQFPRAAAVPASAVDEDLGHDTLATLDDDLAMALSAAAEPQFKQAQPSDSDGGVLRGIMDRIGRRRD